jgi:uncharacterized membrane protein YheB (UPF0754 family)
MNFLTWLSHNVFHWTFWFQPLFYTFHGWLATEMALWMLFHPYEPQYIPGTKIQLPFTPGIFPRGRHKLSISIANTITDILLTEEDLKKQAEKLITQDNIQKTFDALFDSIGTELRDITHIRRLYRYIDNLLPPLMEKLVNHYISGLEKGDDKHFEALFDQVYNRLLPHLNISESQAAFISKALMDNLITPVNVRGVLIEVLTLENIDIVEETIRSRVGGVQGILMRFVDIKKGFYQFRQFLLVDVVEAERLIADMLEHLEVETKLAGRILKFSPQQLPVETLEGIKQHGAVVVKKLLVEHREEISQTLCNLGEEATHSITSTLMHIDYTQLSRSWLPGFKKDLARFTYTYLDKELENMLSKALPAISLNTVIVEKIDQFSAQQLEETIQRICHRELRWLAFLGAFLGFWLGLVSNMIAYWWHPVS